MAEEKSKKKSNSSAWVTGIVVLLIIVAGVYYYMNNSNNVAPVKNETLPFTGSEYNVKMLEFTFLPKVLVIKAGDKVTWTNGDKVATSIKSDSGLFSSSELNTGESYSFVFRDAGVYDYSGSHLRMTGKIIVG